MYLANSFGEKQRRLVASGQWAGWFLSPSTWGIPAGLDLGQAWALDNNCFGGKFDPDQYLAKLAQLQAYQDQCLFVTCPDVVSDHYATLERFWYWHQALDPWPIAFVAQDGLNEGGEWEIPWDLFDALFVGGSTEWKEGQQALTLIRVARALGKHVHVGRVNTARRLAMMVKAYRDPQDPPGPLSGLTYDGTGLRFKDNIQKTAVAEAAANSQLMLGI